MFDFLENSAFFGVVISVASYGLGLLLKKKFKLAILNPLLISIIITIAFLACTGISYEKYDEGAKYLSYLLTPATVSAVRAAGIVEEELARSPDRHLVRRVVQPGGNSGNGSAVQVQP